MSQELQWTLPYVRWREPRNLPPGYREQPRQCHDHLFMLINEGAGFLTVNGTSFQAVPGRLFYVLPSWWYVYGAGETTPLSFFSVHFDWVEHADSELIDPFHSPLGLPTQPVVVLPGWEVSTTPWLDLRGHRELHRAFEELNSLPVGTDRRSPVNIQASGWLLVLLGHLMAVQPDKSPLPGTAHSPATLRRIARARARLENTAELVPPTQVAQEFGWTPDHLRRLCREVFGQTPTELQTRARLKLGKQLLREGLSSAEVAQRCGFSSASYFARLYRREFGEAPRERR